MEEEKKVKSRAAVKKCREKKKREEEENMDRREHLRQENEEIRHRTAVHQQVDTSRTSKYYMRFEAESMAMAEKLH